MRWFIVLLIVANVILFFWVQQQSRPLPGSMPLPPPDVGRLRLLSEVKEQSAENVAETAAQPPAVERAPEPVEQTPTVAPGSVPVAEPNATVQGPDSVQPAAIADVASSSGDAVSPEVEPGPESGSVQSLTERLEMALAALVPAERETDAAAEVSGERVGQSDVQDRNASSRADQQEIRMRGVETGSLVSQPTGSAAPEPAQLSAAGEPPEQEPILEQGQGQAQEKVQEQMQEPGQMDQSDGSVEGGATAGLCFRVGPLDPEGADELISKLPASMILVSDLSEEYSEVDRYYVLIPPLPSRAAGRQKLKELAEAGVTDTWLFPSGEYRNAISLGFFSREGGAKRHAANMVKKGFPAEVRERTTIRERRWLFLKDADGGRPGTSPTLPDGVTAEQKDCP